MQQLNIILAAELGFQMLIKLLCLLLGNIRTVDQRNVARVVSDQLFRQLIRSLVDVLLRE